MKPLTQFLSAALVLSAISTAVAAGDEEITTGGVAMENSSTSAAFVKIKKEAGQVGRPNDASPKRGRL